MDELFETFVRLAIIRPAIAAMLIIVALVVFAIVTIWSEYL